MEHGEIRTMFEGFDGSGREPRPQQLQALEWIKDTWNTPIVAISAATGVGKAAICRSIQSEFGGYIVVPNNHLMYQNEKDYPTVPALKGSGNYTCNSVSGDTSCQDMYTINKAYCPNCPYQAVKQEALHTGTAFVNPMSLIYLKKNKGYRPPPVIVVDEAHALSDMLLLVSGGSLNTSIYGKPNSLRVPDVLQWIHITKRQLVVDYEEADLEDKVRINQKIEQMGRVVDGLSLSPELYTITEQGNYIEIKPILPPPELVASFLDATKIVLLSATLSRFDVYDLLQHSNFDYLELDNPIPVNNRSILYSPSVLSMNKDTPPKVMASWIKLQLQKYPNRNTLVHVTYKDQQSLLPFFPGAMYNSKDNKKEVVDEFKKKGGLLLAAACHEGVDLPGDECRLNLIPKLHKPNLGDPVIQKRRARGDGIMWYKYKTISTFIQQAGRSTRGVDDHSITIVGDRVFKWYVNDLGENISKGFIDAIKWNGK